MFSVSEEKKVEFAPANLSWSNKGISFLKKQYSVQGSANGDSYNEQQDLFFLSNEGQVITFSRKKVTAEYEAWLGQQKDDWTLLTKPEWDYLLFHRKASSISGISNARFLKCTIRGIACIMLFPDYFQFPEGVNNPPKLLINNKGGAFTRIQFSFYEINQLEEAGVVILPAVRWDWEEFSIDTINHTERDAGYYWIKQDEDVEFNNNLVFSDRKIFFDEARNDISYFNMIRLVKYL